MNTSAACRDTVGQNRLHVFSADTVGTIFHRSPSYSGGVCVLHNDANAE